MIPRGDWLAVYHTLRDLKIQITPRILNQNWKYFNSLVSGPGTSRLELRRRKNWRSKISRWTVPFGYSCSLQYFIYYFIISLSWELFATYCICTRGCNASNSWVFLTIPAVMGYSIFNWCWETPQYLQIECPCCEFLASAAWESMMLPIAYESQLFTERESQLNMVCECMLFFVWLIHARYIL